LANEYSIFRPDFYDRAKNGCVIGDTKIPANTWFLRTVAEELNQISIPFGCNCKVSEIEIETARQAWLRDVSSLKIDGGGTPDHFKQAGILSYWLRRRSPIRNFETFTKYDTEVGRYRQNTFVQMYNEIGAYIFGYNLCRFAEAKAETSSSPDISGSLTKSPDFKYTHDMGVLMKNKHISPHALMMIYRALFL